jgi:hypothetical protein
MSSLLSIHGQGLKLNTRADIELILRDANPALVEEVHFGGNTIGVEAAEALAEFLKQTKILKVLNPIHSVVAYSCSSRSPTLPTSSPAGSSPRSRRRCPPSATR